MAILRLVAQGDLDSRANESAGRGVVAGQTHEPLALSERRHGQLPHLHRIRKSGGQADVVGQIREVPVEIRGIRAHAGGIVD